MGKRGEFESQNPFYPSLAFRAESAWGRCSGDPVKDVAVPGSGAGAARVTGTGFSSWGSLHYTVSAASSDLCTANEVTVSEGAATAYLATFW